MERTARRSVPFSHLEQMGRNDRLTCYPVFQQFGTDHTLLFEHFIIEPLRMFAELFQAVVRPHVRGLRRFGIPLFGIAGDAVVIVVLFPSMEIRAKYGGRTVRTDFASVDV